MLSSVDALAGAAARLHNAPMKSPALAPACRRVLLAALFLGAAAACKKSGGAPPIEGVRPADDMRPALVATASFAPLDTISAHVDSLSRTLGLPFAGADLVTMLAAQNGLSPEAVAHLDRSQPIAIAYVAPKNKDAEPLETIAVSTRSPQAA